MNDKAESIDWDEGSSALFISDGDIFVPERALQIQTICDAIPELEEPGRILEICSGEGLLSAAILARFPNAEMFAFDGSPMMLESTKKSCARYGDRLRVQQIDIHDREWRKPALRAHAIVSSLAIHHLDGPEKQQLFRDLLAMLKPGGVAVIADLMAPARPAGLAISAAMWDQMAEAAATAKGDAAALKRFQDEKWNFYADPEPDPIDKPSGLFEQMSWLAAAGFTAIDVHWMKAGHAIFSAHKPK